jgi:hypothetical protein
MPLRLVNYLNLIVIAILRSPLHRLLSSGLTLITVTGRRSGRRYTIPVGYHRQGDAVVVLVGDAPQKTWWRNYRQPGPATLCLRGATVRGTAVVVPVRSEEFRRRAEASFRRSPRTARALGLQYDPSEGLRGEHLGRLSEYAAMVRFTLDA